MPRFSTSLKLFICFSVLPGQPISPVVRSLAAPSTRVQLTTVYFFYSPSLQYLPPFLRIYTFVNLPCPKIFRISVPASPIRIPLAWHCRGFLDDFKENTQAWAFLSPPTVSTRSPTSSVFCCSLPVECLLRGNPLALGSQILQPLPRDLASPACHSTSIHTILGACALDSPSLSSLCNLSVSCCRARPQVRRTPSCSGCNASPARPLPHTTQPRVARLLT